ncbi:hypothetical protein ALC62_06757 [Cyphomyrmex costatus]|uniref:Uncharacterized protein n=1 Tax=Cyphomyrmex costatus TaxID=456900 RepID=A0A195CPF9_9HYME|nr:hypothetical protein ALC62_06757 [Cyphomyrmex costatus]
MIFRLRSVDLMHTAFHRFSRPSIPFFIVSILKEAFHVSHFADITAFSLNINLEIVVIFELFIDIFLCEFLDNDSFRTDIVSVGCFSSFGDVCALISHTSGIFCILSSIFRINSSACICTELSEVSVFVRQISDVCDSPSVVCFVYSMLSLWFAQAILFAFQIPATPPFEDSLQVSFVSLLFQQELLALRLFGNFLHNNFFCNWWWSSLLLDFCYTNSSIGVTVGVIVCTPESSTSGVSSTIVCALKSSPALAVCISSSKVIGIGSGDVCMNVERLSSFGVSEVDTSHVSTVV